MAQFNHHAKHENGQGEQSKKRERPSFLEIDGEIVRVYKKDMPQQRAVEVFEKPLREFSGRKPAPEEPRKTTHAAPQQSIDEQMKAFFAQKGCPIQEPKPAAQPQPQKREYLTSEVMEKFVSLFDNYEGLSRDDQFALQHEVGLERGGIAAQAMMRTLFTKTGAYLYLIKRQFQLGERDRERLAEAFAKDMLWDKHDVMGVVREIRGYPFTQKEEGQIRIIMRELGKATDGEGKIGSECIEIYELCSRFASEVSAREGVQALGMTRYHDTLYAANDFIERYEGGDRSCTLGQIELNAIKSLTSRNASQRAW